MEKFFTGVITAGIFIAGTMLLLLVGGAISAFPVMWIWNWMMPELFGLPALSFWQSFWGVFMCGILFKSNTAVKST